MVVTGRFEVSRSEALPLSEDGLFYGEELLIMAVEEAERRLP